MLASIMDKIFLEEFALYRKFPMELKDSLVGDLKPVRINMHCTTCESSQTFAMENKFTEPWAPGTPVEGRQFRLLYRCTHCMKLYQTFYVLVADDGTYVTKVGQYPAWSIAGDREIERLLGPNAEYYKKALVCESQSYGIGAFGYYRRIVEDIIDKLLDEIAGLLVEDERAKYEIALAKTKKTIVAQEKIDLVKDLLPAILRPDGMNPLATLHSVLSEGLHGRTDDECLEKAESVREVLGFLVYQVAVTRVASKKFTVGMRKLLDKKGKGT